MNVHEVRLSPDPIFGIGMQLVRPCTGIRTFVRNFTRHPLTGRMLPAENSGEIFVGEELIFVNNVIVSFLDSLDELLPMIQKSKDESKILCLTFRHKMLLFSDSDSEDDSVDGNDELPMLLEDESSYSSASDYSDWDE